MMYITRVPFTPNSCFPWFRTRLAGLLASVLLIACTTASAREPKTEDFSGLPANLRAALAVVAEAPSLAQAERDWLFQRIGYRPALSEADWQGLSAREQIEVAYRAAQAATPPNGARFLRRVAWRLADKFEAIRFEPALQALFAGRLEGDTPPITFGVPLETLATTPLPTEIGTQLDALATYVEGTGEFGRVAVLRRHFGLSIPEIERALRERDARRMLLTAATLAVPPPTLEDRVLDLARGLGRASEALAFDLAWQNFGSRLQSTTNAVPSTAERTAQQPLSADSLGLLSSLPGYAERPQSAPSSSTSDGGGGDRGGGGLPGADAAARRRAEEMAQRYTSFERNNYSEPSSRRFGSVMSSGHGWGGVVIGNSVSAPTLSRPTAFWFDLAGQSCDGRQSSTPPHAVYGSITVALSDGQVVRYGPVACDEFASAQAIIFQQVLGVRPWTTGEATGIATVDYSQGKVFWTFVQGSLGEGQGFPMIIHPALVDLDLGWSVALMDLWPVAQSALLRSVGHAPEITAWYNEYLRHQVGTWRFHDRPVVLTARAGRLNVEAADNSKNVVLNFTAFRDASRGSPPLPLATTPNALRLLVHRHQDFARVDAFMRTTAVLRWLRTSDAQFRNGPVPDPSAASTRMVAILCWFKSWFTACDAQFRADIITISSKARTPRVVATDGAQDWIAGLPAMPGH